MGWTNTIDEWEGFGSQYAMIIRAILYVELHGGCFEYTEPSWDKIYNKEEASAINKMINIKDNYPNAIPTSIIVDTQKTNSFIESNIETCYKSPTMTRIKNLFFENNSNPFGQGFHVVVHVRRCNPNSNPSMNYSDNFCPAPSDRFVSDEHFLRIIDSIRRTHVGAIFHICSYGPRDLFLNFVANDTVFHVNEPIVPTFQMMVFADILVTSMSSMSHTAAIFNANEIRYTRCACGPMSHWVLNE
jgi:hypothetical protein